MKIVVEDSTEEIIFAFEDDIDITWINGNMVVEHGETELFIFPSQEADYTVVTDVTTPSDFQGRKYLWQNGGFVENEDFPNEPLTEEAFEGEKVRQAAVALITSGARTKEEIESALGVTIEYRPGSLTAPPGGFNLEE